MVEQSAVNRRVTSSNLVSGARYEKPAVPKGRRVFSFPEGELVGNCFESAITEHN